MKNKGSQFLFSSVLLIKGRQSERSGWITWLCGFCCQGFFLLCHGCFLMIGKEQLLKQSTRDKKRVPEKSKSVNLISLPGRINRRAFLKTNSLCMGDWKKSAPIHLEQMPDYLLCWYNWLSDWEEMSFSLSLEKFLTGCPMASL